MAKKATTLTTQDGGLHLAVETEDWVAVRGTSAELEQLGRLLIEFAFAEGQACAILDSPSPLFQPGSLGICLYRTADPVIATNGGGR